MEDDRGAVDDGEFVVASSRTTPLLEQVEAAFDDVAPAIADRIESGWAAAAGTAAFAVPNLIGRLGDHRGDAAGAQMPADRLRGIGLVTTDTVGPGPGPTASNSTDLQMPHQVRKHRRVAGLTGADQRHQWLAVAVDEVVHFGASAAGAADRVVRRLAEQIRVVRPSPLCGVMFVAC